MPRSARFPLLRPAAACLALACAARVHADDFIVYSPHVIATQSEVEVRGYRYDDPRADYHDGSAAELSLAHTFNNWWKAELYVAKTNRFDRTARSSSASSNHFLVLCENETGYHNLCRLSSLGYLEGFHYRPRVDDGNVRRVGWKGGELFFRPCKRQVIGYDRQPCEGRRKLSPVPPEQTRGRGCRDGFPRRRPRRYPQQAGRRAYHEQDSR